MMQAAGAPNAWDVHVSLDRDTLFETAAGKLLDASIHFGTGARLVLPGGSTPGEFFDRVVALGPGSAWAGFRYVTSDERCVPPDHPGSNAGLLWTRLLDPLGIPAERLIRFRGEDPPERAAEKAHRELVDLAQRVPLFDLVVLGLGEDGHTASLFPTDMWPEFGMRWSAVMRHPEGDWRLTLTPAALRSTRATWFLVSGAAKAQAVADCFASDQASPRVPARIVAGANTTWLLDREAASLLPEARLGAARP